GLTPNQKEENYFKKMESQRKTRHGVKPLLATNKSAAKKYFKQEGWHYYKKSAFCRDCFEKLNSRYFVIDRFNQFYCHDLICDTPDPRFLMTLDQA
ncbi:hypothetical protein ACI3PF_17075, partial [Lactococcus lactis]